MSQARTVPLAGPFGPVELLVRDGLLAGVRLGERGRSERPAAAAPDGDEFAEALRRYFCGRDAAVPIERLDMSGCTPFQRRVFRELLKVRFGQVTTYGELAARLGMPKAARAVGGAMARNPLPIVVPCHRVVAAGGRLGGFSGGLDLKRDLLTHEGWAVGEDRLWRGA